MFKCIWDIRAGNPSLAVKKLNDTRNREMRERKREGEIGKVLVRDIYIYFNQHGHVYNIIYMWYNYIYIYIYKKRNMRV